MSPEPGFERQIAKWLHEEAPRRAPDRILDAVRTEIDSRRGRRPERPWRNFEMSNSARFLVAAAVGVLAIGGAIYLIRPGPSAVGTQSPAPSDTLTATPNPTATAVAVDYTKLTGWLVFEQFAKAPDGSTPAGADYGAGIWLVHADGTNLHELAPGVPADGKSALDVSPDGKSVVFQTETNTSRIWEVSIDGGQPRLISTDCSGIPGTCTESDPNFSPDGKRIAFVRGKAHEEDTAISIRDLGTGDVKVLDTTRLAGPSEWNAQPSWSPDGTRIVYQKVTAGADGNATDSRVMIVNADGTGMTELPLPADKPWGDPDWSPDGTRIVLSSYPIRPFNVSTVAVYSVAPDGSGLTLLTSRSCGGCGAPTWTPDGKHIIFWGLRSPYMMSPTGADAHAINVSKLGFSAVTDGWGYYWLLQPTP